MVDSTMDTPTAKSGRAPLFRRYVIFSVTLFLAILIGGGAAFLFSMRQITRNRKAGELCLLLDIQRIKLEALVDREIAIVRKMAGSPLIRGYFENANDRALRETALKEIKASRGSLLPGASFFWINDNDKMFYIDDDAPFWLDPALPENYWYRMTLNGAEAYNFNINYNPDLNVTNIWINAPVLNESRKPVGILGSGANLSEFVNAAYRDYRGKAALYFFNARGEITGAENVALAAAKKSISEELGDIGEDIAAIAKSLEAGKARAFAVSGGQAAVISIPLLGWYAAAVWPDSAEDFKSALTALFFLAVAAVALIITLSCVFVHGLLKSLRRAMASLEEQNQIIMSGMSYASKVQRNLLPHRDLASAFADYSAIWKPRDVVGGDIYWVKTFDSGTVLCVCDCTGHGTPGALLTMLVVSALESAVQPENCGDTADIVWQIDGKIAGIFNRGGPEVKDGCDLAVLFIANDGSVTFSAGHTNVFVCDGKKARRIRGQRIFVGDGRLKGKHAVKTVHIPADRENKFYVASDGLFDQPGEETMRPFGYKRFERLILENHAGRQVEISDKIWAAFEKHRGVEPRVDDFQLITFKPRLSLN